jgi:hypothetical protein
MDNIIEPTQNFDFTKLTLAHPVGIQGGAYFTKIEFNKKPLYIQTTKSLTRQGIVKTGKKYYCDLMFNKNSEDLINWLENLEDKCKKLIYEKKEDWFQGSLEESDIENAFNPLIRVYKSGKYYLLRTIIKNNKDDNPSVKIYNENEIVLSINDINNETEIISILEIQGIKFTSRNFQIEIDLKQIMVIDNEPIFDNCLIKKNKVSLEQLNIDNKLDFDNLVNSSLVNDSLTNDSLTNDSLTNDTSVVDSLSNDILEKSNNIDKTLNEIKIEQDSLSLEKNNSSKKSENINFDIEFEDLSEDVSEELKDISNSDLNLDNNDEVIKLKKPNQVYFELYKEARNKAKQAKKNAILAYLEAKNIKKTYMIENIYDSDSEFEAEIDEVSESELEGL